MRLFEGLVNVRFQELYGESVRGRYQSERKNNK